MAAYLKKLGHSRNSWVGNVEAASGMASLLSALPVGYLADTVGRSVVLKWGGGLLLVTAILHAALMEWIGTDIDDHDEQNKKPHVELYLGLIMALWGVGGGIVSGPAQALYADSTPKGNRSLYYVYLYNCYNVASCLGPLVSIALFQTLGDDWDLYDLRIVIYVGLGLEVVNGALMMFFDDQKALDEDEEDEEKEEEEDNNESNGNCQVATETNNTNETETSSDEEQPCLLLQTNHPSQPLVEQQLAMEQQQQLAIEQQQQQQLKKRQAWIPYIMFVHSLVFALGSGMTVKFFPLFFKDEIGMSPSQVQGIYVLVPLVLASCSGLGQAISSKGGLGRVPTAFLLQAIGVLGLYSMVFFKSFLNQKPLLLVPIYILRTSLMNASYPLEESILMDFVPKNQRARWKSLESVASFGWCGSAAIGGWLSDRANGDYTFTFLITAIIQTIGTLIFALLWPLVPVREGGPNDSNEQEEDTSCDGPTINSRNNDAATAVLTNHAAPANDTTLQAPLLSEQNATLQARIDKDEDEAEETITSSPA